MKSLTDKIAFLTKIVMEKAEDRAEDLIVEAEGRAEELAVKCMQELRDHHRSTLAGTLARASEEEVMIVSGAEFEQKRENLLARQEQVAKVSKQYREHLLDLKKEEPAYAGILSRFAARGIEALGENECIVILDSRDGHLAPEIQKGMDCANKKVKLHFSSADLGFGLIVKDLSGRRSVDFSMQELLSSEVIKQRTEEFLRQKNEG